MPQLNRKAIRRKVHRRIRKKVNGTAQRPRLAVHFSNKHVYAQLIDDVAGVTVAAASTKDKSLNVTGANKKNAESVGDLLANRAKEVKVDEVVFDRGGHIFHTNGKVASLADAARKGGLKF